MQKCYKIQIKLNPQIYILQGLNCIWIFHFQNLITIHLLWSYNICVYFIYTFGQVKINVEISFFEIYNEKIHDLLASSKEKGGKKPTVSYFYNSLYLFSAKQAHKNFSSPESDADISCSDLIMLKDYRLYVECQWYLFYYFRF